MTRCALVFLTLLAACGQPAPHANPAVDAAGAADAATTVLTVAQFATAYMTALCQGVCMGPPMSSTARCLAYVGDVVDDSLQASIAAGRIKFDAAAAQRCIDGIHTCDATDAPADCNKAFIPLVAAGQPCTSARECKDLGGCELDDKGCARCAAVLQVGDVCEPNGPPCKDSACQETGATHHCQVVAPTAGVPGLPCVSGSCAKPYTCDPATDLCQTAFSLGHACKLTTSDEAPPCAAGLVCTPEANATSPVGTCEAPGSLGQPCFTILHAACSAGLWCRDPLPASGLYGLCIAASKPGEACESDTDCQPGLRCLYAAAGKRCFAPVAIGAACETQGQCQYFDSVCFGRTDTAAGVCKMTPDLGQPCEPQANPAFELVCLGHGEACSETTKACVVLPGAGAKCYGAGICGPGSKCDFDSWDCVALGSAGTPCGYPQDCGPGFFCSKKGTCAASACGG